MANLFGVGCESLLPFQDPPQQGRDHPPKGMAEDKVACQQVLIKLSDNVTLSFTIEHQYIHFNKPFTA
jgi:hypothetical protein